MSADIWARVDEAIDTNPLQLRDIVAELLARAERAEAKTNALTRSLLYVLDAVKSHGDRAAIVAAHAALAKSSAPNVIDERNELRRQIVDLRDELETMTADRGAKADEAAEYATERVTAEERAEQAEAELNRIVAEIQAERDKVREAEGATARDESVIAGIFNGLGIALRIVNPPESPATGSTAVSAERTDR